MAQYPNVSEGLVGLSGFLIRDGREVGSRNGERVLEVLHAPVTLTHPWQREVLVPGRSCILAAQIAETMWVLSGRGDIEWLSNYLPRAKDFSDDGETWRGAYGPRIRAWKGRGPRSVVHDQLDHVVELLRSDPTTRRAVITLYDPAIDYSPGKDIPCNNWISFQSREGKLHLMVSIRSNDLIWGWSGINAFEWSALQEIVAGLLGIEMGVLSFSISSLHVYDRHWGKARLMSESAIPVQHNDSPRFEFSGNIRDLDRVLGRWFEIESFLRHGESIDPLVIDTFPEPMMGSWLRVIAWYWSRDEAWLEPLRGTNLYAAAKMSPKRSLTVAPLGTDPFTDFVVKLHAEKHEAYGDSWKRRGEQIGILANVARKIDRLGVSGAGDTSADTAIDLLVYLAKYRLWLTDTYGLGSPVQWSTDRGPLSDFVEPVTEMMQKWCNIPSVVNEEGFIKMVKARFSLLEHEVGTHPTAIDDGQQRGYHTMAMMDIVGPLARSLWLKEQTAEANKTRQWKGYES